MYPYIPNTSCNTQDMLDLLGIQGTDELFLDIPQEIRLQERLDLEKPMSELEVIQKLQSIASKNKSTVQYPCFLGAGAYDHYIPSVVPHLSSRSEFYTSYTPYQPEISQGTLQGIFEYQSLIAELTAMDVSNASMYDGGTALAEAALIACDNTKRKRVFVSRSVHPESRDILLTYLKYHHIEVLEIPLVDGTTDMEYLKTNLNSEIACVIAQNPNFLGLLEDMPEMSELAHQNQSLFIASVNPISLGVLTPPGHYDADIAVGEGQSLGNPLQFGGPYLGFFTANKKWMRKIPGRICGVTHDQEGKRAFVLTLQAREQHIRREKAISNICSNQGLLALNAAIYLATLGKEGLREVSSLCVKKAHFAFKEITASGKYKALFPKPFFMEFSLSLGALSAERLKEKLYQNGIIGGFNLSSVYPEYPNATLLCVTEKRTREEILKLKKSMEDFI
jgi:glycine dehydrogenase subunit 1